MVVLMAISNIILAKLDLVTSFLYFMRVVT